MKQIFNWFKAVFGFNQKEINGFIVLSILMVLLLVAPFFYSSIFESKPYDSSSDDKLLQKLLAQSLEKEELVKEEKSKWIPNKYKKKEYQNNSKKHRVVKTDGEQINNSKPAWKKENYYENKVIVPIEINSADTLALKQIKGIGEKLSQRIINYRKKMGGFHSINQLKEVYGIDSNLINENKSHFLIPNLELIKKLNLNEATVKELVGHPYISYNQAVAIVNYRQQHGEYKSLEDLDKIHLISEVDLFKMKEYLSFQ